MPVNPAPRAGLRLRDQAEALGAPLPPLLLTALQVASTVAQGLHGRRRIGMGEAFWQFRRFETGDPVGTIDWRQSGKSQHLFVRENEWEAAQTVYLWRDASPSMAYRSLEPLPTKRAYADLLLMALSVLLVKGGERICLLNSDMRPAGGDFALGQLALHLQQSPHEEAEGANLPVLEPLPRHAHLIWVSDFLSPLDQIDATIHAFSDHSLEAHLVQVHDPAEPELPFTGRVDFLGLEGERPWPTLRVEGIRAQYRARYQAHRDTLAQRARSAGWTFSAHGTDRPAVEALLQMHAHLAPPSSARPAQRPRG